MDEKAPDFIVFLVVIILLAIGVVMVFSSTSVVAYQRLGDSFFYLRRQIMWASIGILAMLGFMKFDYHKFYDKTPLIFIVSLAFLGSIYIPGLGHEVKGAVRWLNLGPLPLIQVAEIAKLGMVIYLARYLSREDKKISNFLQGLLPALLLIGIMLILVLLQPDLGTTVTMGGTAFIMFIGAGAKYLHLGSLIALIIPALTYMIVSEPYRRRRLFAFLNPWADPLGTGFHIIQSLYALGSGGLFGVGLGNSKQKFLYLPEPGTDFIFSVLGEELGYLGIFSVIALYLIFTWRGIKIAIAAKDLFGSLLALGITIMISLQAIVNMGVVSASMPVTGITLPFISYGGSSIGIMMIGVGILLNISKQTDSKPV